MAPPGFYKISTSHPHHEVVRCGASSHPCCGGEVDVTWAFGDMWEMMKRANPTAARIVSPTIRGFAPLCDGAIKKSQLYLARKDEHDPYGIPKTACMYCAVFFYYDHMTGDIIEYLQVDDERIAAVKRMLVMNYHDLETLAV